MKKIFLLVALLLSVGLVGMAQAATSSIDNLPGGAGIAYFQCGANGDVTLLNVQNVSAAGNVAPAANNLFRRVGNAKRVPGILPGDLDYSTPGDYPLVVHVVFYDHDSNEVINFNVPLSPRDNWGAAVTCDGTRITITPSGSLFTGMPYTGKEIRTAQFRGSKGYATFTITAVGTRNTLDPRQRLNLTRKNTYLPDAIFVRTAILNLTSGSALAFNGNMLQGFANMVPLVNTYADYLGISSFDARQCPASTFGDVPFRVPLGSKSTDDDNGIRIDSHELFLTDNANGFDPLIVNDNCAPNWAGAMPALGSGNGVYWGRYNMDAGTSTVLVTVFPANSGPGNALPLAFSGLTMGLLVYNDDEDVVSDTVTVPEVAATPFGSEINTNGKSGEARIAVTSPMFGYTLTTGPTFADAYPLVAEKKAVYHPNITSIYLPGQSGVIFLGSE